jgi:hypothetical protein
LTKSTFAKVLGDGGYEVVTEAGEGVLEIIPNFRDLFGRTQVREQTELIIVADRFTPIRMQPRNERLGLLNGKVVNNGTLFLGNSQALQARGGVCIAGWSLRA